MCRHERPPILQRGDLGWLLALVALAVALFIAALAAKLGGYLMKRIVTFAAIAATAATAVALSGCLGAGKVDLPGTINALAAAGCKGTISNSVTATTAAGLSPGSASVTHNFTGSCDPANAVKVGAVVAAP